MTGKNLLPAQLLLDFKPTARMLNSVAKRSWRPGRRQPVHDLLGASPRQGVDGLIASATGYLLARYRSLLQARPLRVTHRRSGKVHIRVLDTLVFEVDRARCEIRVRAADRHVRLVRDRQGQPQSVEAALAGLRVDLFRPLDLHLLVELLTWRSEVNGTRRSKGSLYQLLAKSENPGLQRVLLAISERTAGYLQRDRDLHWLQAMLAHELRQAIGEPTFFLALRARTDTTGNRLDAGLVCSIWRHWPLYSRMNAENRQLLPLLTAWLECFGIKQDSVLDAAVPMIRTELLGAGLPPRAWRYLCRHGLRSLRLYRHSELNWHQLVNLLEALDQANWPELPPLGFLGLLRDTAGNPAAIFPGSMYDVLGWFWNWTCRQAHTCRDDPRTYRQLQDQVAQWAWLIRQYQPRPDANQQRQRLRWLQSWATLQEERTRLGSAPTWSTWVQQVDWSRVKEVQIVPLLSPLSLREEGRTMHNCADRYVGECEAEQYLMLSLREPRTGRRIALLGLNRSEDKGWIQDQLAGPCNRPAPASVQKIASRVLCILQREQEMQHSRELFLAGGTISNTSEWREIEPY